MRKRTTFFIIIIFLLFGSIAVILSILYVRPKQSLVKPNILLVTVCSLRQDHLGCYGYSRDTSPNMDNFSSGSTIFKNCYTNIPWTKPSVIAMMTGEYPYSNVEISEESALAPLLRSSGYLTCGIIGSNVPREGARAHRGFDIYLDNRDLNTSKDSHTVQADTIVDEAIKFLKKPKPQTRPLFLWVFFKDPHWPYLPPPDYRDKFLDDALYNKENRKLSINIDRSNSIGGIGEARLEKENGEFVTDKSYYISQYDAEILFLDSQFGRLIEFLKREGNYQDWVIILVSDHGESLGEENYFFDHGYKLNEGVIKIPLMIKLPRQAKKSVIKDQVSICDIYPTILSLAGPVRNMSKNNSTGNSILAKAGLWRRKLNPDMALMLENSPEHENEKIKFIGSIWEHYKLIYNLATGEKIFYDILKDEVRLKNYSGRERRVFNKISNFIKIFFNNLNNKNSTSREQLKSLGYLQ
ncbi:MAG: sulfatase [Candidatus Omnitrophota bacterium]|nr:sulfatase [Candidatus Omnitrophota bacterium]MBU1928942.1 sulfatase [Candidatus Omnitrophota bacterium]MBU2034978.1 sulfatase [Candidatus Omnitrophota bacterium]